jgi:hypothetical protein
MNYYNKECLDAYRRFPLIPFDNFGKIRYEELKKLSVHELLKNDDLKMKKTKKKKIEYQSNEPCPMKNSIKKVKFRNEPWNWIVRKATVIISKVTG